MKNPNEPEAESRREFLAGTLRGACLIASTPLLASLLSACGATAPTGPVGNTQIQIDTSEPRFQALATVGGVAALNANSVPGLSGNGVFVIRESDTSVLVLDRTCTHQGCQVGAFSNGVATCPCHGSRYNEQGGVVNGPASHPLRRFPATITEGVIEFTA